MAIKKSLTRKQLVYRKTKVPVKPTCIRVTKVITIALLCIFMLPAYFKSFIDYAQQNHSFQH